MAVKLFEHQKEALRKLRTGSILWGGVGSGKSITGLAWYYENSFLSGLPPRDLYIITTARKRDTGEWEGELARFGLSIKRPNYKGVKVVIDSWNNIAKYIDVYGAIFLFDEQRVVGYGKWTKSFLKITRRNDWILLSATPGDCWMDYLPVFIANGFYRNKSEFQRDHVMFNRYNTKYPQITGYMNEKILRKHRDAILIGMSFERKTEQHHVYINCEWNREVYDQIMKTRINPFTMEPIQQAGELCLALRRVVNTDERRYEKLKDLIYAHPKSILFYNYDYELDILRQFIPSLGANDKRWQMAEWNGHKHEPLPTGNRWVYCVQYAAGAEGWNCVETDTVIFLSQSYSYKAMVQAAGRIDRINTAYHDLYYYHLSSCSKIDLAMRRALKEKRNFNESAFAGKSFSNERKEG